MVQSGVYVLCMLASLICLFLLARGYLRTKVKLLFWVALSFVGYSVSNLFLFLDIVLFPEVSLKAVRNLTTMFALTVLLYGLIWEAD